MEKYACYCRVSTSHDQSNDVQKQRLTDYCQQNGYDFDMFEEVESSRKTRPVKQAMLQRLRNGEYTGIIITKLDRYARSSTELILEVTELLSKNVQFIAINDNLDFSTSAGKLYFQLLAIFSEFERSIISDRIRESLSVKKNSQGIKLGRPNGSKDKKTRKKSGYILRHAVNRQKSDIANGEYRNIEDYINDRPNAK